MTCGMGQILAEIPFGESKEPLRINRKGMLNDPVSGQRVEGGGRVRLHQVVSDPRFLSIYFRKER
jgi:hypothetical protein